VVKLEISYKEVAQLTQCLEKLHLKDLSVLTSQILLVGPMTASLLR
jgi:hypothetical protein